MFEPLAGLEGVGSAAQAARDAVDVLLRDRGLRKVSADVTAEALLRGAHASAPLAGSPATLDQVRRGAADPLAIGAVRMTSELMSLAPQVDTAPVQVWTRLHQLAAAELGHGGPVGPPADQSRAAAGRHPGPAAGPAGGRDVGAAERPGSGPDPADQGPGHRGRGGGARRARRTPAVPDGQRPGRPGRRTRPVGCPRHRSGRGHGAGGRSLGIGGSYPQGLRDYAERGLIGVRDWLLRSCEVVALGAERSPLNISTR